MARLYTLEEKISPVTAFACGLQHMLAMFVGVITPPLIIGGAVGLEPLDLAFFVSMALFSSGVCSFIQIRRIGPVGSGLLSVQGTSFTFVPMALEAGRAGGLPLILGMAIATSPVEMVLSRFIGLARKLFPPVVTGSVVMLIGLSLIQVGMTDMAGGFGADNFGSFSNLAMGFFVMAMIVVFNRFGKGFLNMVSIALGLLSGYILAAILGWIDFSSVGEAGYFTIPQPFKFGLDFNPLFLVPWIVGYCVTSIETVGDLTATSTVSEEPVVGPVYIRRLQGGMLADGINSLIAGIFNSMPNTTFSQNNGVIALTGVASRRAGYVVAGLLVLMGLFPKLAALISVMPKPVLGGATVVMFGMVAVAGLKLVAIGGLNVRNQLILAITLGLSLGAVMVPDAFNTISSSAAEGTFLRSILESVESVCKSGVAVAGISATVLNLVLPASEDDKDTPVPGADQNET